jgi:hypothetical protein
MGGGEMYGDEQKWSRKAISTSSQIGPRSVSMKMGAAVKSLEGKATEVQADLRDKAKKILQYDDFQDTMKKAVRS